MRTLLCTLAFLFTSAEAAESQVPTEIEEAMFAYAIVGESFNLVDCLQVSGANPPDEVLLALAKRFPHVAPMSECDVDAEKGTRHKPTGREARYISLSRYERLDDKHARIEVATGSGSMTGEGSTLLIEAGKRGWYVSGHEKGWVE